MCLCQEAGGLVDVGGALVGSELHVEGTDAGLPANPISQERKKMMHARWIFSQKFDATTSAYVIR
jgi:hypothetical protein